MNKNAQEAVNQHEMVALPNGKEAPVLVANLNESIDLVIVSKNVLSYLTKLLPKASVRNIIMAHVGNCNNLKYKEGATIEEFVDILRAELEFHTSVNIIQEYIGSTAKPEPIPVYEEMRPEQVYPKS